MRRVLGSPLLAMAKPQAMKATKSKTKKAMKAASGGLRI